MGKAAAAFALIVLFIVQSGRAELPLVSAQVVTLPEIVQWAYIAPLTNQHFLTSLGDTTPPDTTITSGPSGSVASTSATFTFTSTEAGSTFQCALDGAAFGSCPAGYTGLAQGSHTFQVRARDAAGNTDPTPASRTWTVDTVAPDTSILTGPSGSVASTSATFTFSSNEAGVTFQCSLDGVAFASCPVGYTGLAQGSHTFQVRATDAAGNNDLSPASRTWTVDTVAPDTTITTGPSGTVASTSATFTFTSNEAGATFQCALDGAAFASCPVGYTGLAQGSHTFQVRATDAAGNNDLSPASRTWTVDTVAPDTTITSGPSGTVASTSATFTFSSNEAGVTFQCALDAGAFSSCPAGYTGLAQGSHTFQVRAVDAAGNMDQSPASRTWTVDTSAPEMNVRGNSVTIADGDGTPDLANHTDFGSATLGSSTVTRIFTIENTGTANLNLTGSPKVVVGGAHSADFSVISLPALPATPVAPATSTTFQVLFDPSGIGVRSATISIANDDANENPYNFRIQGTGIPSTPFDYDGDRKADLSVWRPSSGDWWISRSNGQPYIQQQWGNAPDRIAPADYDGDGKTDIAVYRPSEGNWYVLSSLTSTFSIQQWGDANDVIVPGDYTGDGKADHAIYRPSSGEWFIRDISNGSFTITQWGNATDKPVPADYNGDGTFDIMAYRPTEGNWYLRQPGGGFTVTQWGNAADKLVPADYTGDGSADLAVWRPSEGNWYIRLPGGGFDVIQWGNATDLPTPADFDGNSETNIAIWRPADGMWWILNDTGGGFTQTQWGSTGDRPTPNAFVR